MIELLFVKGRNEVEVGEVGEVAETRDLLWTYLYSRNWKYMKDQMLTWEPDEFIL